MMTELSIGGVYIAPIVAYGLGAAGLFFLCRWLLTVVGFWRWVWHPALFEIGLFVAILSLLVLSFP